MSHIPMKRPSILITEDHASTRIGIREILREEFPRTRFGEARDETETIELMRERRWDLLILDISLPGASGVEVLREVKQVRPEMPVLIYSAHHEEEFAIHMLRAQASGYLTKERAPEELCHAVRHILQGGIYLSKELCQRLLSTPQTSARTMPHELLSRREFEVLQMIAAGKPAKTIAAEMRLSPKTVGTYRMRILRKLQLRTTAEIIKYAIRSHLI